MPSRTELLPELWSPTTTSYRKVVFSHSRRPQPDSQNAHSRLLAQDRPSDGPVIPHGCFNNVESQVLG